MAIKLVSAVKEFKGAGGTIGPPKRQLEKLPIGAELGGGRGTSDLSP